jgi:hypothetical protein
MSKVAVTKSLLDDLAHAVSAKSGEPITLTIPEMTAAVRSIQDINNQDKTITPATEQQVITADTGYSGLGQVTVKGMSIEGLEVTPTISDQTFNSSSIDGYLPVTVKGMSIEGLEVTPTISDQTFNSSSIDGYLPVTVKAANLIAKTVDPSSETQVLLPSDEGILARQTSDAVLRGGANSQGVNVYGNNNFDLSKLVAGKYYKITGTITETITDGLTATKTHSINDVYQLTITKYFNIAVSGGLSKYSNIRILSGRFRAIKKEKGDASLTFSDFVISEEYPPIGYSQITVNGDADLLPENIKKDIDIFGVVGTYEGTVINNQDKTVTPTKSQQSIAADSGYTGLGTVTVNPIPSEYIIPEGTLEVTQNGTVDVTQYASATVSVPSSAPTLQSKTVTPTESQQVITADTDYDGLDEVTVSAISSTYVGSRITRRSSTDLSALGATVTAPAGYYAEDSSKSVQSGSVTVGAEYDTDHPSLITVRANISPGYLSGGQYQTKVISDILPIKTATTITPSETTQTAVEQYKWTTGAVTVNPIPSEYIIPTGELEITTNGTSDVTNYASVDVNVQPTLQSKTVTPTESQQTVSPDSGYDALSSVTVDAISSTYVGSGIEQRDETDLTASGAAVTVPAGYYAEQETKSVENGELYYPTLSIDNTTGKITAVAEVKTSGYLAEGAKKTYIYPMSVQERTTITPTESSQVAVQSYTYTLGNVSVAAIPSDYIGSGITRRDSTDLIANGNMVYAPAGYYDAQAYKGISSGALNPPGYSLNTETGQITITSSVETAGYMGPNYSISNTRNLDTQAAATITPTESEQTVVSAGKYTLGDIKVSAISSTYVGSGITRRSSSDLTAPLNTVTVPAGYYAEDASKTISEGSVTVTTAKGNVVSNSVKVFGSVNYTQGFIGSGSQNDSTGIIIYASDLVSGNKAITQNGTGIDVTKYATVSVNVQPTLQSKTVTPTESSQTITPDTGYDGMDEVTVNAISSSYVGSGIDRRSSSDLTGDYGTSAAGKYTVTAPSGYYESDATYSLTSKGASNITTSTSGGNLTVTWEQGFYGGGGKTIATVKNSDDLAVSGATVTVPAGYYAAQATKSVVSGSATNSGTVTGSSATITAGTNVITVSKVVSITPVVTEGYISSGTAGDVSVNLKANVTTKAAATITPGTTNQTIAAGTYLTGTQTIAGDADLVASNIKAGVQIFGVTGNLSFITCYTGTSDPSSSLGQDGDVYLKVAS